jgi:D-sedoheptulose 7-phosphate isomerase
MDTVKHSSQEIEAELYARYPKLESCRDQIRKAFGILSEMYEQGGMLYIAGNGGSAADSFHIAGELVKSFRFKRVLNDVDRERLMSISPEHGEELGKALEYGIPAVSMCGMPGASTAIENDIGGKFVFAQIAYGMMRPQDVYLGISTSGNSENVVLGAVAARAKGAKCISLAGARGCRLDKCCDAVIHVPETETFKIQELHLPMYHALCAMLEAKIFA